MVKLWVGLLVVTTFLGLLLLGSQGSAQGGVTVLTGTVTIDGAPAPQSTVVQAALADGTIVGTSATGLSGLSADQYRIDVQASSAVEGQQVTFSVQGATVSPAVTAIFRVNRVIWVDIAASTGAPVPTATAMPRPTAGQGPAQGATVLTGTVTIDGAPAPQFTVVQAALADGTIVGTSATGLSGFSAGQYRIDIQVSSALDGQQVTFSVQGATVSPAVTAILRSNRVILVDIAASTGAPVATATATAIPPTATPVATATPRPTAGQGPAQGATVLTGTVTIDGAPAPQFTVVQAALADGTIVGTSATGLSGFSAGQYRIDVQVSPALDGQQVTFSVHGATVSPAVTAILRSNRVIAVDIATSTGAPVATATATPQPAVTPGPTATPRPTARQGASQGVAVLTGTVTIDGAPAPQSTVVQAALADGTIVGTSATGLSWLLCGPVPDRRPGLSGSRRSTAHILSPGRLGVSRGDGDLAVSPGDRGGHRDIDRGSSRDGYGNATAHGNAATDRHTGTDGCSAAHGNVTARL